MKTGVLALMLLLPFAAWADGMVGVPDPLGARISSGDTSPSPRRSIVINGGGGSPASGLAEYNAYLSREATEAEARKRQKELELAAALDYRRGSSSQAARDTLATANLAAQRKQRDVELEGAANAAVACHYYDPKTGCRGPAP